jgi:diketogulonate reductase-like aldo/keto reductase
MTAPTSTGRRRFLQTLGLATFAGTPLSLHGAPSPGKLITHRIPSSGERIPAVGLGSWLTFDVGFDLELRDARTEVMRNFFMAGGSVIDSSPMYGSSQDTIGYGLEKLGMHDKVFAAEKVWVADASDGPRQMERSREIWGVPRFDLMQVHNILSWKEHLPTLYEMKKKGEIRYVGITTSHGRRHGAFEEIMTAEPLDFIQVTYNIQDREVEERILPLAREKGIAVIINRPFDGGGLIRKIQKHPLPAWASEIDAANWAQLLLKFIISHPSITCAIPATTRVNHVIENMGACRGRLPDAELRRRMIRFVEDL